MTSGLWFISVPNSVPTKDYSRPMPLPARDSVTGHAAAADHGRASVGALPRPAVEEDHDATELGAQAEEPVGQQAQHEAGVVPAGQGVLGTQTEGEEVALELAQKLRDSVAGMDSGSRFSVGRGELLAGEVRAAADALVQLAEFTRGWRSVPESKQHLYLAAADIVASDVLPTGSIVRLASQTISCFDGSRTFYVIPTLGGAWYWAVPTKDCDEYSVDYPGPVDCARGALAFMASTTVGAPDGR